ncbi:MAG: HEPN domain-containing protein [Candidatus Methanofastidiosia archaeon]|jgi:HEPN domain-containing protein
MKKNHPKPTDSSLRWLKQSEADFSAAQDSLKSKHFEWACFQAQQAAEKALKAFLYSQGLRSIITHSITELLIKAQEYASFDISLKYAKTLDSYYIPTRYPNGLPGTNVPAHFYSKEDAELCINYAELILKIVKKYMKS